MAKFYEDLSFGVISTQFKQYLIIVYKHKFTKTHTLINVDHKNVS